MTCTGDQEVYAIFKRLSDNLGELVYMIFIGLPAKMPLVDMQQTNQYEQRSTLWVSHVCQYYRCSGNRQPCSPSLKVVNGQKFSNKSEG